MAVADNESLLCECLIKRTTASKIWEKHLGLNYMMIC